MKSGEVDVVLLWVDSEDKEWQKTYATYSPQEISTANHSCRFRPWDNLEYIFRGIETFMPWVRKVHFVTQGHLPPWLNKSCEKLNILMHNEIFTKTSHLPTFNSNAIEINFNKIKSLSERFILFNDDFFVLRKLPKERFFVNNLPVDFLVQGFKRKGRLYQFLKPQNVLNAKAINNNIDYINTYYHKKKLGNEYYYSQNYSYKSRLSNYFYNTLSDEIPWLKLNHVPQPHLKSTFDVAWKCKPDLFRSTSSNKFRTKFDITHYLFRYINLLSGNFFPYEYRDYLSREINVSSDMEELLTQLAGMNLLSVSDTEKLSSTEFEKSKIILKNYLDNILPGKSSFEI